VTTFSPLTPLSLESDRPASRRKARVPAARIAILIMALWLGLAGPLLPAAGGQEGLGGLATITSPEPFPAANLELRETTPVFLAIVKALAALALVLGLIVLFTSLLKKLGWGSNQPRGGSLINVLETRMIAPKKYVAIIQLGEEFIAVGVTDQQINLLTKLEQGGSLAEELASRQAGPLSTPTPFAAFLQKARGKTIEPRA
jgi:flagellar protein FliO/FliZ